MQSLTELLIRDKNIDLAGYKELRDAVVQVPGYTLTDDSKGRAR